MSFVITQWRRHTSYDSYQAFGTAVTTQVNQNVTRNDEERMIFEVHSVQPRSSFHVNTYSMDEESAFIKSPASYMWKVRNTISDLIAESIRLAIRTPLQAHDSPWDLEFISPLVDHVIMIVTSLHPAQDDPSTATLHFIADRELRLGILPDSRSYILQHVANIIGLFDTITDEASAQLDCRPHPLLQRLYRATEGLHWGGVRQVNHGRVMVVQNLR
jgi:hypothetical protein